MTPRLMAACMFAATVGAACTAPDPVIGSAPPSRDIVEPDLYNSFRRAEALADGFAPGSPEVAEASRTIEILFRRPIALDSFSLNFADGDIDVTVALPGAPVSDPFSVTLLLASTIPEFSRSAYTALPGEGDCAAGSADRTCDTLVLRLQPSALALSGDYEFHVHGAGIEAYLLGGDGVPSATRVTLGGESTLEISVRDASGGAPELRNFSLRIAGEGGDVEGLLELGQCVTCGQPPEIFVPEYYLPPSARIEGQFSAAPARLSVLVDTGADVLTAYHDVGLTNQTGGPFVEGSNRTFRITRHFEIGQKIANFEFVTDELLAKVATPARFSLGPPTQSGTGRQFVHRVGATGDPPSVIVNHFTIAHVRFDSSTCPALPTSGPHTLVATRIVDPSNPRRTVTSVEVLVGPADGSTPPVQIPATAVFEASSPEMLIHLDAAQLVPSSGDRLVVLRARNSLGDYLGSDRVVLSDQASMTTSQLNELIQDYKDKAPHYYDLTARDRGCYDALVQARRYRRSRSADPADAFCTAHRPPVLTP